MINLGQSVLIAGFAREGQSTLRYLLKHYPHLNIAVADVNPTAVKDLSYQTFSGPNYLSHLHQFDTVIRSPGISRQQLASARQITTAINLFMAACPGMTIGVTGTKGKSTTSALIHHFLKTAKLDTQLVGNIGTPALDFLEQIHPKTHVVIELSSYQLADLQFSPHLAVILPISEEHLSYHGDFAAYVEAKKQIVIRQTAADYVVYHAHNHQAQAIAQASKGQKIAYAATLDLPSFIPPRDQIPLLGRANLENILAAAAVAQILNIKPYVLTQALKSFKPLPHRLEPIGTYQGITFYNDSLSTTPVATLHALEALGPKVATLIAGGFDRGLDYSELGAVLAQSKLQTLLLLPDTGPRLQATILTAQPHPQLTMMPVQSMAQAVQLAFKHTPKGQICLLSPAAASFNLFKDYVDRGNTFKRLVQTYSQVK
ncbi:UDP-N-acetylmuramoylalanine--D-glutamate ligase [Microgenomates group bacterium RBG_16_45_19]|nr:MAG: UDP-N-acetylmuramoylalanine--D-glutamate ligase [Microgenomates group bacterium RBG_16_45_19]